MPLARYFLYVGGVLLALLLILDGHLPRAPVAERANANPPVIRIHSEPKTPQRVVYDTSLPTIDPPQIASDEGTIPFSPAAADVAVKLSAREAFAQLQPFDARQPQPSNPKKREPKLPHQARTAKRYLVPHLFLAERQARFGWYRNSGWWGG